MKKLLLLVAALALSGCARHPAKMPVDVNPSQALKFARAMNLRNINDEGDSYYIYNSIIKRKENDLIYPLVHPVHKDKAGRYRTAGGDLVGSAVVGAFLGSGFGLAGLMISSGNRKKVAYFDGLVMLGSWNNLTESEDNRQITAVFTETLAAVKQQDPSMNICGTLKKVNVNYSIKSQPDKDQKTFLTVDFASLPPPPVQHSGTVKLSSAYNCFIAWTQKPESLEFIKEMSVGLGAERAIFIPGSKEHEPVVYHNGEALYFRK